ncbi:Lysozyme-like protein [Emericellopsis cladophorae]|uniref:Lysozyme-like protein n=1 Tax=Emericellopsis cladophorae TaxID=2686198 RepID=A0A9P9XV96_9HYPO|nr:Lysozyme-like protein [Emericellopsis cladophorae]KAI6778390.1 Lysozyme-like protein [Emericellopsis cladophorae]
MVLTVKSLLTGLVGAAAVSAQCTGPPANDATVSLIAEFEDLDPSGYPTVGYGHLCADSSCSDVPYSIPLSEADGRSLLRSDMAVAQNCITLDTGSNVVLNANQYGAFVSWAFNVGCGNSGSSTLISRLNAGENPNTVAAEELPKWKYSNGVELPGLVRRRNAEVDLAQTATSAPALPACS